MESEDEHTDYHHFSHPYLRYYEEEEAELHLHNMVTQLKAADPEEKPSTSFNDPRIYVTLRFFKTIQGFHKGSLDLSGRHALRYETLIRRWNSFVSDLLELSVHATQYEYEEPGWRGGRPDSCIDYKFSDSDKMRQFREKWCIVEYYDYAILLLHTQKTISVICENPMPKFQQICLTSLPVEVLEIIMGHASLGQARLLSAACQFLRQVGLRFIFGNRTLCLEAEPDWPMLRANPDVDHSKHLHDAAIASKDKLLKTTTFLLSRPDLTQSLRTLTIQDGWSRQSVHGTPAQDFDVLSIPDFYAAIYSDLKKILEASFNLSTLTLLYMNVMPEVLQTAAHIATLHTINLHMCQLDDTVCERMIANQIRSSDALLNLKLLNADVGIDLSGVWHTILLCPQIRTLTARASGYANMWIPPDIVRQRCNPFTTLERVCVSNFYHGDISALSVWMTEASGNSFSPGLKLTHFKIHTPWGMDDTAVLDLLSALRWSPNMQVLVLEGLRDAELELIDRIAHACPNLLGLTLIRRQSNRQSETKLASWPHPSYEYASRFNAFTRLSHFGWNFNVETFGLDPTPAIMNEFEEGFPDPLTQDGWKETQKRNKIAYFDDTHLMAGPFAVHCPTLRTFAIVDRMVRFVCLIDQTPHGTILSKQNYNAMSKWDKWNPVFARNWPLIEPPRVGTVRL